MGALLSRNHPLSHKIEQSDDEVDTSVYVGRPTDALAALTATTIPLSATITITQSSPPTSTPASSIREIGISSLASSTQTTLSTSILSSTTTSESSHSSSSTSETTTSSSSSSSEMSTMSTISTTSSTLADSPASIATTTSSIPTSTPFPIQHDQHAHLTKGQLAAIIVLPILVFIAALLALLICCIHRRRMRRRTILHGPNGSLIAINEKWGSLRSNSTSSRNARPQTALASHAQHPFMTDSRDLARPHRRQNTADTSPSWRTSLGDAESMDLPPRPLPALAHHPTPLSITLVEPSDDESSSDAHAPAHSGERSVSPLSATYHHSALPSAHSLSAQVHEPSNNSLLTMPLTIPRPISNHSFTSTLYSDTASVHSARMQRLSLSHAVQHGTGVGGNSFAVPDSSPVSGRAASSDPMDIDLPSSPLSGSGNGDGIIEPLMISKKRRT